MRRRYCRQWVGLSGKVNERLSGHALDRPFIHRHCTDRLVDGEGIDVPVEDPPLEAAVALVDADPCHRCEETLAESAAAELRPDVEDLRAAAAINCAAAIAPSV